jgi:hypothetical protein
VVCDRGFVHKLGEEGSQSASLFAHPSRSRQPSRLSVATDENNEDEIEEDGNGSQLSASAFARPGRSTRGRARSC